MCFAMGVGQISGGVGQSSLPPYFHGNTTTFMVNHVPSLGGDMAVECLVSLDCQQTDMSMLVN